MSSDDSDYYNYGNAEKDNFRYYYGYCPQYSSNMYKAVFYGNLNRVRSLLNEHSAEKVKKGKTFLHVAAAKGHDEIVDLFCQHNFPINKKDKYDETPLHLAVKENHTKVFNLLIGKSDVNARNIDNKTPLHFAAEGNYCQLAEILLQNGADVSVKDVDGQTALHLALMNKGDQVAEFLIKNGADINAKDSNGTTPLHLALRKKEDHLSEILLQNDVEVNVEELFGTTPLHLAASNKKIHLVEILLKKGAKVNVIDYHNWTPLSFAAKLDHIQLVDIFLKNGAKVAEQENKDICKSPLYRAAENGNMEIVSMLIKSEYYTANIKENACKAALNMAVYKGNFELVKYLIENVFEISKMSETQDPQLDLLEISDNPVGALKYSSFLFNGLLDISLSANHFEIWEYLLKNSSKIHTGKYSQLHFAVQAGQVKTVMEILKQSDTIKSDSLAAKLAIYIAVENGNENILKILLKAGYSVDSCYKDRTPLHIAATINNKLVKILLEAGADINSKTKNNYTLLDFALAAGQSDVVKFLLERGAKMKSFPSSLENVLRRGSDKMDCWIVTPLMFQNLLKLTEMILIVRGDKKYSYSYSNIFKYTFKIRVSREKENSSSSVKLNEEASNEVSANKSEGNISNGEFRPEILRCLLSYLKYHEIRFDLRSIIFEYLDVHSSIADILEYEDKQINYYMDVYNVSSDKKYEIYENMFLSLCHILNIDKLTNISTSFLRYQTDKKNNFLKLIVARLVLLPNDPHSEKQKLVFYNKHNVVEYRYECEEQIKLMQKTEVVNDCNVTFYDMLTQPAEKIANCIRDKQLLEILESSYLKFPAYTAHLKMNVERGKRRRDLIDKCINYIFDFLQADYKIIVSSIDIEKIFKYLSVADLWSLSGAFT